MANPEHSVDRRRPLPISTDPVEAAFQAILYHSSVADTQDSYTMREAVDPQASRGKCRSPKSDYATNMQLGSLNTSMSFL